MKRSLKRQTQGREAARRGDQKDGTWSSSKRLADTEERAAGAPQAPTEMRRRQDRRRGEDGY